MRIEKVIAADGIFPPVVWIAGSACTGCTMSLLNSVNFLTVDDLLINSIDLKYIDTAMATAGAYVNNVEYEGANALAAAHEAYTNGGFVLVVEGAIPTATPPGGGIAGDFCRIGELVPSSTVDNMYDVVNAYAQKAAAILAVGTCSSFGGIPGAKGAYAVTGAKGLLYHGTTLGGALPANLAGKVFNIPGCPPHPDWIVGTIAAILADDTATLTNTTTYQRPRDYYGQYQCNAGPCPWRFNNTQSRHNSSSGTNNLTGATEPDYNRRYPTGDSKRLGREKWTGDALGCLGILGCKGRKTKADCSARRWNADVAGEGGVNWCVGSRAGCHGCTEPTFPDKVGKFFTFV